MTSSQPLTLLLVKIHDQIDTIFSGVALGHLMTLLLQLRVDGSYLWSRQPYDTFLGVLVR